MVVGRLEELVFLGSCLGELGICLGICLRVGFSVFVDFGSRSFFG